MYGNALTPDSGYSVSTADQITRLLGYITELLKLKSLLGVSKSLHCLCPDPATHNDITTLRLF